MLRLIGLYGGIALAFIAIVLAITVGPGFELVPIVGPPIAAAAANAWWLFPIGVAVAVFSLTASKVHTAIALVAVMGAIFILGVPL